jgi:hypothetical protein
LQQSSEVTPIWFPNVCLQIVCDDTFDAFWLA